MSVSGHFFLEVGANKNDKRCFICIIGLKVFFVKCKNMGICLYIIPLPNWRLLKRPWAERNKN